MPESYDIRIDQGSVFDLELTYEDDAGNPINLTGYTARMQLRLTHDNPNTLIDLASGDEITLGGQSGQITIHIGATATAGLPAGRARYDLELVPGNVADDAFRLIEGAVTITPEVTR